MLQFISSECRVMENKRRIGSPDDAESSNENAYESEKDQRKKRKIIDGDKADYLINKYRKKDDGVVNKMKSRNACVYANESTMFDDMDDKACSCIRPRNSTNSHLPLKIMFSVKEEKGKEIERREEIGKVMRRRVEQATEKAELEQMMALLAGERVRAEFQELEQERYELLDEERGLHSSVEADFKNLLQGKSHSELEVLQSEIVSIMRCGLANVVEYWEPILRRVHMYKTKAFLEEEIHANILRKNLNAGYEEKNDETETEEAEGTGSSCSPELLRREEIADNFEMSIRGVMEEGDALSSNNDEVILQSQVHWWHSKCRPRKPKYFNCSHVEYEQNKYNQTHYDYDIIMAYYGTDS